MPTPLVDGPIGSECYGLRLSGFKDGKVMVGSSALVAFVEDDLGACVDGSACALVSETDTPPKMFWYILAAGCEISNGSACACWEA